MSPRKTRPETYWYIISFHLCTLCSRRKKVYNSFTR